MAMKKLNFLYSVLCRIRNEVSTRDLVRLGLKVGKNFSRQEKCIIDQSHCWLITIGDNVTLAPRVHILAHDASTWPGMGYTKIGRVNIGNNVFIGAATIILPNTNIGNNVIIGAGSVITKNIPDNTVVAGNPAHIISDYDEYMAKNRKLIDDRPVYDDSYTLRNPEFSEQQKYEMYQALSDGVGFVK